MDSEEAPSAPDPQVGEHIGPYEVLRPVARGGMASVLAVRHVDTGQERGMKLLLPLSRAEEARTRFRREFRALSRLKHPNILEVYEWGMRGDRPWFTMELLEGRPLKDEVAAWEELTPDERWDKTRAILVQVTRALAYIHDRGLVHRDITPSNIMVGSDGSARIMDFGVVKDLGADLTQVGELVGTVAYISPEQILGDTITARADLYSLGTLLYLMLTGRRPFVARTLQGYLEKHLKEMPRPPRAVQPLVPDQLDKICMRLLAKDPADRYASAVHLLNVLGQGTDIDDLEVRWPPRSVGRTYQKARIREAIDNLTRRERGAAILLEGKPGQGKTRMLDLAESHARSLGLTVARGRCRPQDRPFGAFIGIYRTLAGANPPEVLRRVMEKDDDEVPQERYPVIAAFKDLIVARAPVVIVLDDLEKADPATVELITYLVRNTLELAAEPVSFLMTHELSEVESLAERQLRDCQPVELLSLGPLQASEVEELVLSMLPNSPAALALAKRLHEESAGSPAFIADMLRGLIDEGVLIERERGYEITLDPGEITRSRLPVPASLRQALADRLAPLPADAVRVARVLAIARRRLDLDCLVEASPLRDEEDVIEAIDVLLEAGVIEERREGDKELLELAQARFRDVLLDGVTSEERRKGHQRVGEVLERANRHRPASVFEELAYHFEQAGLAPKAYTYLARAARRHLNRSLHEEALAFIDRALRMESTARPLMLLDDADRRLSEARLVRSRALYHIGDWTQALADVKQAYTLANEVRDGRLQARVAAELGGQLRNQGSIDEAAHLLQEAILRANEVGDPTLRTMPTYQLGGARWAQGKLDEAERLWRDVLATAQETSDDRMLAYGYNGLGILAASLGETIEARSHLEHSARLFEELGALGPLTIVHVNLVELYLSTGLLRKALHLAERAVARAREVNHPHGIALGLLYRAQVLLAMAKTKESRQNANEALRIIRKLGTSDDEIEVQSLLVRLDLIADKSEEVLARIAEMAPLMATESEGRRSQLTAWEANARARLGQHDEATALLESIGGAPTWPHFQIRIDLARARAWRRAGHPERSAQISEQALTMSTDKGYRYFQLLAHHELAKVAAAPEERDRHKRQSVSLARSLAANLSPEDGRAFTSRPWGGA